MKLLISDKNHFTPRNNLLLQRPQTGRSSSRQNSAKRKSIQVTCRRTPKNKTKEQSWFVDKINYIGSITPKRQVNKLIETLAKNLSTPQYKNIKPKKQKSLIIHPELTEFHSFTTIDSFRMKRSNTSQLWGCNSPVNKLLQIENQ